MKIVISGFYGFGNTGDEAILESVVDSLRNEIPEVDITVFSFAPEETSRKYHVKSLYRGWRRDVFKKINALKEADLMISGGGGLLQDKYPTKFIFGPLPYYLLVVFLTKLVGTKVMFFSQGIGPVNTRYGKLLMKLFANMADRITVRDEYSKELLHKLGVNRPKTTVTSDIVFAYQMKPDNACLGSLSLSSSDQLVAVSVRPWFHHTYYYKEIAVALDQLIEKRNITPVFVPMEGHHDHLAAKQVVKQMIHGDKCHLLGTHFSPNQYLNFISKTKLVMGMRLHSLIFATLTAVPHVGISYDKKVESLLKRNGMWEFSTDLESLNAKEIVDNAISLLDQREHHVSVVKQNADLLRHEAYRNMDILKEHFLTDVPRQKSISKAHH